jgi:hypothetical protein
VLAARIDEKERYVFFDEPFAKSRSAADSAAGNVVKRAATINDMVPPLSGNDDEHAGVGAASSMRGHPARRTPGGACDEATRASPQRAHIVAPHYSALHLGHTACAHSRHSRCDAQFRHELHPGQFLPDHPATRGYRQDQQGETS